MAEETADRRRSSVFSKLKNALKGPQTGSNMGTTVDKSPQANTAVVAETTTEGVKPDGSEGLSSVYAARPNATGSEYSVQGKSAIVTGAGSGINLCFARLLLSKGCNVLIADLTLRPEAQELVDAHSKEDSEVKADFVKTDVTDWKDLRRMFDAAYSKFGSLDIVCPGAGIFEPHWSNFWHPPGSPESKDTIDGGRYSILDINVAHPIRTTQLAIAHFLSPPNGEKVSLENPKRIVHISSIAGQVFGLPTPLYMASKWAISGFVRSMGGLEARLGIKVAAVAPGLVKTPLFTEHPEKLQMVDETKDVWVLPEEVAEAMLKCVEDSSIPSGTILEVGSKYTREVQPFNDPGPFGRPGISAGHAADKVDEVFGWLAENSWGKAGL